MRARQYHSMSMRGTLETAPPHTDRRMQPTAFVPHTPRPLGSGVHARYPALVAPADGIDRAAWAKLVADLLDRETKGKKLPFARLVGRDPRTVDRWLRCEVTVDEESVRQVARALDKSPVDLLVQVGYYRQSDLATIPQDPREDPVVQQIMADPRLSEDERLELVQEQVAIIDADRRRRMEDYERMMRRLDGRRDTP